jgi:hypothetical protein
LASFSTGASGASIRSTGTGIVSYNLDSSPVQAA